MTPADYIPCSVINPEDKIHYLDDRSIRGVMALESNVIAGPLWSEIDLQGPVYADTLGYLLGGVLGDESVSGSTAPFTHAFSVYNGQLQSGQPTSYTITDYKGWSSASVAASVASDQYAGVQFNELQLKFNGDGLLEHTTKGMGFASAQVTKPTPSFTAVTAMAGWIGAVTIAGGSRNVLEMGEVTFKRPVNHIDTIDTTQAPYRIWVGPLDVEGKFTFITEDRTEYNRFLTNAQPSLDINFQQGAGAALTQVLIHCSQGAYIVAKPSRSKDYVTWDVEFKGITNVTDAGPSGGTSPAKVTLQNAKPSGTFT